MQQFQGMCRCCGVWLTVGVRKYFEQAGAGRKGRYNLGRRSRGKEVQHVPMSNMKCVLGALIMEEEERLG